MRRTQNRLADGREIFYFDEDSSPKRTKSDLRDLSDVSTSHGSMRFDLLTGEWIAIAGHRQQRIFLPGIESCPLCPSTSERLSEIPESDYSVVVFENRFPSFSEKVDSIQLNQAANWGEEIPAAGRCEVVAYSPDHYGSLATLKETEMRLVISAWIDRSRELSKLESVEYVFVFENRGGEVGVTLHHPHGQIYGYPYVPAYVKKMLEQARNYREIHNRSMLDDVVAKELLADERIVYQDSNWVVFVPHAARWPFEIQIHPLRNISFLTDLNQREFDGLAKFIPQVIKALDNIFESPLPYMAGWIQAPTKDKESVLDARLFMRIVSVQRAAAKLKYLAGSESLMGAWISDVLPEEAAKRIRTEIQKVMSR
jgi:UDPglucose--hexose-1-phosphate uridylyltransferase